MIVLKIFDDSVKKPAMCHSRRSNEKDMQKLVHQIKEASNLFENVPGRTHTNFPKFEANSVRKLELNKIKLWMEERWKKLITYTPLKSIIQIAIYTIYNCIYEHTHPTLTIH